MVTKNCQIISFKIQRYQKINEIILGQNSFDLEFIRVTCTWVEYNCVGGDSKYSARDLVMLG